MQKERNTDDDVYFYMLKLMFGVFFIFMAVLYLVDNLDYALW